MLFTSQSYVPVSYQIRGDLCLTSLTRTLCVPRIIIKVSCRMQRLLLFDVLLGWTYRGGNLRGISKRDPVEHQTALVVKNSGTWLFASRKKRTAVVGDSNPHHLSRSGSRSEGSVQSPLVDPRPTPPPLPPLNPPVSALFQPKSQSQPSDSPPVVVRSSDMSEAPPSAAGDGDAGGASVATGAKSTIF